MFTFTCIFVSITLFLTALATLFLTLSLFSNEWEYISYETDAVEKIAQAKNHSVQWLPGQVARVEIEITTPSNLNKSQEKVKKTVFYLIPAHGGVNNLCADLTGMAISCLFHYSLRPFIETHQNLL